MCQAYAGERQSIVSAESAAIIRGFIAAYGIQPESVNPETTSYAREAWSHGWHCFQQRTLPYAVELRAFVDKDGGHDYVGQAVANQMFKECGILSSKIKVALVF